MNNSRPIGVFDSGMGGLTVLHALQQLLPHEDFIYLGDTARLPYGTKSRDTVIQYALHNTELLTQYNLKLLVIACNTASAVALPALTKRYPSLPIVNVIEPGAQAAVAATRNAHIAILATETTIQVGAYQHHIKNSLPNAKLTTQSCSLLVALAEEGWHHNQVAQAALTEYLSPMIEQKNNIDCLVLGCTHFPVFKPLLTEMLGDQVRLVDSATATALFVKQQLTDANLHNPSDTKAQTQFLVTDTPERFQRVGQLFLNAPIARDAITLIEHQQHQPLTDPNAVL